MRAAMKLDALDVLVVGGGMAGSFAAMAAAERGCRVGIVEPSNVLGGQGTAGGVAGFCGDTARVNHVFDELVNRLADHRLINDYDPLADRRDYDLEWCAYHLQEMMLARGVTPLLHSRVLDARGENGRVTEVTLTTAAEMLKLTPRFVIDATGICIVPQKIGLSVQHDGANKQLPMSLYFTLWDTGEPVTPILPQGAPTWKNDDEIPMTSLHIFPTGKVEVKMKVVGFDAADGLSVAEAEVFARRYMMGLIYYLQTHGYRGVLLNRHVLAGVSRQIGVREQNRLIGEHVLTKDEMSHGCIFDDAVAVGTYHLDYHWPDTLRRKDTGIGTMVESYHIPLRCMIPKGGQNLLVPGRGASADQLALSSLRVMTIVSQMGYAAGVTAAEAMKANVPVGEVDIAAVQRDLEVAGQMLDLSRYGQYLRHTILTEEEVVEVEGAIESLALERLANGRFAVTWRDESGRTNMLRSEGRWQVAPKGTAAETTERQVKYDENTEIRIAPDGDASLEMTRGGQTHRMPLFGGGTSEGPIALAATERGVAAVYVGRDGRVRFWHGSPEHIADPPVSGPAS